MVDYTTFTKHASWLVPIPWSLKKLGHNLCKRWTHNALKLCYIDQWTWQEIPCTRGLECYRNNLFRILVASQCWVEISWAPCLVQITLLSPPGNQWWWCDVSNFVGWLEIGSPSIFFVVTMKNNYNYTILPPFSCNSTSQLW
jgi:hypothetical protein